MFLTKKSYEHPDWGYESNKFLGIKPLFTQQGYFRNRWAFPGQHCTAVVLFFCWRLNAAGGYSRFPVSFSQLTRAKRNGGSHLRDGTREKLRNFTKRFFFWKVCWRRSVEVKLSRNKSSIFFLFFFFWTRGFSFSTVNRWFCNLDDKWLYILHCYPRCIFFFPFAPTLTIYPIVPLLIFPFS